MCLANPSFRLLIDSDLDVCPPGHQDLHDPVAQSAFSRNTILHLPANHPERCLVSPRPQSQRRGPSQEVDEDEDEDENEDEGAAREGNAGVGSSNTHGSAPGSRLSMSMAAKIAQHRRETQAVLEHHVRYSQLTGKLLEMCHNSIHVRGPYISNQNTLLLKADAAAWSNNLTRRWRLESNNTELSPDPTVFPFISCQYAILLINRPCLSLDPSCAEFRDAIQTCISAANSIIDMMEQYSDAGGPLFWPGYMSAAWMSGLVVAFAARLGLYSRTKATRYV